MTVLAAARPEAWAGDSGVVLCSYSTGQNGSKLKWIPVRARDPGVVTAAATGRLAASSILESAKAGPTITRTAAAEPLGDRGKDQGAPPAQLNDGMLDGKPAVPAPAAPLLPAAPLAPNLVPPPAAKPGLGAPNLQMAAAPQPYECPDPKQFVPISKKNIIESVAASPGEFPKSCPMDRGDVYPERRPWTPLTFTWKASALCSKPIYFEDVQLERYGHSWGPCLQPLMSAGHFFLAVPALPYFMGLYPPNECIYSLGYYRPGSCAPYLFDPFPLSVRAAVIEGAVITGGILLIP